MRTRCTAISVAIACLAISGCGKKFGPEDVVLANPSQAVVEARELIRDRQMNPAKYADWLYPSDLPQSLRLDRLQCAIVHEDHVDLLIVRAPDWWVGVRIWSADSKRAHADKKTDYPDVYFFTYSNDFPDSAENIR